MKRKIMSMFLVTSMVLAMAVSGCKGRNAGSKDTKWAREAIENLNESDKIQVEYLTRQLMKDGSKARANNTIIVDKEKEQVYEMGVVDSENYGESGNISYYGVENGEYYIIHKAFNGLNYMKEIFEDGSRLQAYIEKTPIDITGKSVITVLGEEKEDGKKYTKVKIVTPDFERIHEKDSIKEIYKVAKTSETYKEQLREAETKYEKSKQEIVVWFDKDSKPVKVEEDNTIENHFLNLIYTAYQDTMGIESDDGNIVEKCSYEMEIFTGDACDEIKVPTDYELSE